MVEGAACAQLLLLPRACSGLKLARSGLGDLAVPMVLLPLHSEQRPLRASQQLEAA